MKHTFNKQTIRTILNMSVPAIIESFFVAFVGLVDSYMVSSLGSDAVASVGLTTQPKFVGLAIFFSINISVSALVARRFGEKKRDDANRILSTALTVVITLAVVVSIAAVKLASAIMSLCGSSPQTHENAVLYFRIIMGGMIFNCIQMSINSALRGAGNTKITMRTNIVSNLVNVVLNYLLIGGNFGFPRLEIAGAAIATVFGTVVGCIISFISILKADFFISLPYIIKQRIRPALSALKDIFSVAYSIFFEQVLLRIGFVATAVMAADQGNNALAAHQVGMNIMGLTFSFGDGIQAAAVALIGKSLGERNPEKAKEYGAVCNKLGILISLVLAVVYFYGATPLMSRFFKEDAIIKIGVGIMYVIIFVVLFQIQQVVYMGALRGAGDTLYTAIVSAISVTVVRTAASYIFGYTLGFGIIGIWFGVLADQVARYILSAIRFKAGKWVNIKI